MAGEIAEALQEAHARRFLHRDLKPANIMLTEQGHVKVMDFGLAKRVEDLPSPDQATREIGAAQLTAHGTIVGTPDYMSPEQVKGVTLDARSDLFSFGVILAEMISGRHPFRQPSTGETLSAVLREPPDLSDDMPHGLTALVAPSAGQEPRGSLRVGRRRARRSGTAGLVVGSHRRGAAPRHGAPAVWKRLAWSASALGLALAGYLIVTSELLRPASRAPGAATVIRSIAVLPLDNYSGDPNQDYFAEGMTDELTAEPGDHQPASRHLARIGDAVQGQGSAADA